jgi:hypothetical protein
VIYGFSPRTSLRLPTQVPRCAGKFAYETTQSACKLGEGGRGAKGGEGGGSWLGAVLVARLHRFVFK